MNNIPNSIFGGVSLGDHNISLGCHTLGNDSMFKGAI